MVVALVGTLNPSGGDVSVFYPLEHTGLAAASAAEARTSIFARYTFVGSLLGAVGSLAAALPDWFAAHGMLSGIDALRAMFFAYGAIGVAVWALYLRLPAPRSEETKPTAPLGPSRGIVWKLAALFSVDSFAGGFVVNALLALWLLDRFEMSLASAGAFFFWTGLLSAGSQLAAAPLARRIGLVNTMVFTHIPSSIALILAALSPSLPLVLALLLVRAALSQMDVPTRSSYLMAVVTGPERAPPASFTSVPRSLAAAGSPAIARALFAAAYQSLPLVICGALKITYDLLLLRQFRSVKPPEEQ